MAAPEGANILDSSAGNPAVISLVHVYRDTTRLLNHGLERFFNQPSFSDLTIVTPTGKKLCCHQVVLAACSRKFATVLEQGESSGKELPIQGVDGASLEAVIRFFYISECPITVNSAVPIYDVATKLEVLGLASTCEMFISQTLQPQTCALYLEHGLKLQVDVVVQTCVQYCRGRFEEIAMSLAFTRISAETVRKIAGDCRGHVSETNLVTAVARWAVHNPDSIAAVEELFQELGITMATLQQLLSNQQLNTNLLGMAHQPQGAAASAGGRRVSELQSFSQQLAQLTQGQAAGAAGTTATATSSGMGSGSKQLLHNPVPMLPSGQLPPSALQGLTSQQALALMSAAGAGGATSATANQLLGLLAAHAQGGPTPLDNPGGGKAPTATLETLLRPGSNQTQEEQLRGYMGLGSALSPQQALSALHAFPGYTGGLGGAQLGQGGSPAVAAATASTTAGATGSGGSGVTSQSGEIPRGMLKRRSTAEAGLGRGEEQSGPGGSSYNPGGRESKKLVCHVDNCNVDLTGLRDYHQRFRICDFHLKISSIQKEGVPQRFCQQCGRFHHVSEFDGNKRSCRARLQRHNARRRKKMEDAQQQKAAEPAAPIGSNVNVLLHGSNLLALAGLLPSADRQGQNYAIPAGDAPAGGPRTVVAAAAAGRGSGPTGTPSRKPTTAAGARAQQTGSSGTAAGDEDAGEEAGDGEQAEESSGDGSEGDDDEDDWDGAGSRGQGRERRE